MFAYIHTPAPAGAPRHRSFTRLTNPRISMALALLESAERDLIQLTDVSAIAAFLRTHPSANRCAAEQQSLRSGSSPPTPCGTAILRRAHTVVVKASTLRVLESKL
jgi:hypothetical protein